MLTLFNTLGKRIETFSPDSDRPVTVFTCGPSVYQRSHIGNFRTFLFEDILVRYLEYLGYKVIRGMSITDVEDKAIVEAKKRGLSLRDLTERNIRVFKREMGLLRMKIPDLLLKASDAIGEAVTLIKILLDRGIAYWHKGNVYFDPLKYPGFGELYGLDISRWPLKKRRFHKDTYPGMRWNLGDFILWHGGPEKSEVVWKTRIGEGRPSWNIQDAALVYKHFNCTLSFYCGGIDNLIRHHDYTRAILESVRPYPMARFWLHCQHLIVRNQKMSKSKNNPCYVDNLIERGFAPEEIRFFLIYGHYREKLEYSEGAMENAAESLRRLKRSVQTMSAGTTGGDVDHRIEEQIRLAFRKGMDNDLDVRGAINAVSDIVLRKFRDSMKPSEAMGCILALKEIDRVLQVIF